MTWRKSSYSGNGGLECVELARTSNGDIATRDSKAPNDGMLRFNTHEFREFLAAVKRGNYDK
ncbi:MAG TPA: DUF397 domain-containing protein [Streptosporangiaceae bacterium]|nr:DUF397 domain-containing protein [Streptosporangiaceae bacterium]